MIAPVRSVAVFDRSQIDWGFAARSTVGVALPLLIALSLGMPAAGAAAAIGGISVGFASLQGFYRTRAAAMLWTAFGMAISSYAGAVASHSLPAVIVGMMLWGYGYGIIASLGPSATAAGLNSCVAFIVFSNQSIELTMEAAAIQSAFVFAGGVVQTLLLVSVWPLRRFAAERRALAKAYRALAAYARALPEDTAGSTAPPSSVVSDVRTLLADPQPFARRGEVTIFQGLLDEAVRIRAVLGALATSTAAHGEASHHQDAAFDLVTGPCADVLSAIADGLAEGRAPRADAAWARLEAIDDVELGDLPLAERSDLRAFVGQLRAAWRVAQAPADLPITPSGPRVRAFPRARDTLQTLRANLSLDSSFGRLAVRQAVTLGIAMAVYRIFSVVDGYWLALTVVLLLRPDYTTTISRGVARVVGTLGGAAIASLIASYVHLEPATIVALCILFVGICYLSFNANYALYAVSITAFVIFLLSLLGQPEPALVLARIEATVAGAGLAVTAMLVWPTWESAAATERIADVLERSRVYAKTLLGSYVSGNAESAAVSEAQSALWKSRAAAEASVDRMVGEPQRTHGISAQSALGLLAASRRLGLGLLSLNAHRELVTRPVPVIEPLAAGLDEVLAEEVAALRERRPPRPWPPLRDRFDEARRAAARSGEGDEVLREELDFVIDSVNSLAAILREAFEPAAP